VKNPDQTERNTDFIKIQIFYKKGIDKREEKWYNIQAVDKPNR